MNRYRRLQICLYVAVAITCSLTLHILSQPAGFYAVRKDRSLPPLEVKINARPRRANNTKMTGHKPPKIDTTVASALKVEATEATATQSTGFVRPRFTFSREPYSIFNDSCQSDCGAKHNHKWSMVNFIKSAAGNFIRRELLRRTWGSMRYVDSGRFATVFVVGKVEGLNNRLLAEEWNRYGDLLLFDGPDDYRSMPLKTLAGMQWAKEHLPGDYFYSSGDDDFMLNVGRLQEIVDEGISNVTNYKWPEYPIICTYRTLESAQPYRNKTGLYKKWYISEEEYKWPFYPKSCLGGFYSTRVSAAAQLFDVSVRTPHLSVDDVWITGILREKLGMPKDMVITPNKTIAHHFLGYKRKRSDIKKGFMKNEWAKIYGEFRTKDICTC